MCRECWAVKRNGHVCNKYLILPPAHDYTASWARTHCKINNRRPFEIINFVDYITMRWSYNFRNTLEICSTRFLISCRLRDTSVHRCCIQAYLGYYVASKLRFFTPGPIQGISCRGGYSSRALRLPLKVHCWDGGKSAWIKGSIGVACLELGVSIRWVGDWQFYLSPTGACAPVTRWPSDLIGHLVGADMES
jgi:hypothetical protein